MKRHYPGPPLTPQRLLPRRSLFLVAGSLALETLTACAQISVNANQNTSPHPTVLRDVPHRLASVWVVSGGSGTLETLAWRPNTHQFASGSSDGQVRVWSIQGKSSSQFTVSGFVSGLSWSPDGAQLLVATTAGKLTFWPSAHGWPVPPLVTEHYPAVSWSPTGDLIAIGTGSAKVLLWHKSGNTQSLPTSAATTAVTCSPNGGLVASGTRGGHLHCWSSDGTARWTLIDPSHTTINALAWTADGSLIAAGDNAGNILLADSASGKVRGTVKPSGGINALRWSPTDNILGASTQHFTVVLLSKTNLTSIGGTQAGYDVNNLLWSPDGSLIIAGLDDAALHAWQVTPPVGSGPTLTASTGYMAR